MEEKEYSWYVDFTVTASEGEDKSTQRTAQFTNARGFLIKKETVVMLKNVLRTEGTKNPTKIKIIDCRPVE